MVSSIGSAPSFFDMSQSMRTQRGYGNARALAQASDMSNQLWGVDASTNASLAIFGVDTSSHDGLFAATNEGLESSLTVSMARAAWAKETPSKADERTTAALAEDAGGLGALFDLLA
ncbi:hypothetical protein [Phreatobacter sp.]|uniref:hypothetical protein n=1 Tax=Phreatobacter sp. TaxID=1966341 RepID=UPI003F718B57